MKRALDIVELMDDPEANQVKLFQTIRNFALINRVLSRWDAILNNYILKRFPEPCFISILDIGCGGGDTLSYLFQALTNLGYSVEMKGIDPDPRLLDFHAQHPSPYFDFECVSSSTLRSRGERFDIVISNHLLHHLDEIEILQLVEDAENICTSVCIFNDIHRSIWALLSFPLIAWPFAFRSFIFTDGLLSIRRSYTPLELALLLPESWRVSSLIPFRILAIYER